MGVLLLSIKRRLLGSTSGKREVPADADATAGVEAPPSSVSPPQPARLPLPTPRRVPLGGLAAELESLEQRFALLPHHQPASKEEVRARLAALQSSPASAAASLSPAAATAARADGKVPSTQMRSPRRLAKGTRRPAAARKPWVDVGPPPAASPEPPGVAASASGLSVVPDAAGVPGAPAELAKRSKLANLKRRQARRSAEGGAWASPGGGDGAGLLSPQASEGPEAAPPRQQLSSWLSDGPLSVSGTDGSELSEGPHSERTFLHGRLTPRVLAAASRRASTASQPRSRLASEAGSSEAGSRGRRTTSASSQGRRSSSSDGGGELGLTLAPWAAPAPVEPALELPARHTGSAGPPPDLDMQAQQRWPAAWPAAAAESEPQGSAMPSQPRDTDSAARSTATPKQRLPHTELPADLLSLRDSATLARRHSQSGRPPLPSKRRAQSVQEWHAAEKEVHSVLPPLKAAAAGETSGRRPSLGPSTSPSPNLPALVQPVQLVKEPSTCAHDAATAEPAPASGAAAPSGLTRAQQRQQEAWGSLAGVGLEDMLRQAPHRTQRRPRQPQPLDLDVGEVADRENSTLSFNSSPSMSSSPTAPALQASPKPPLQQSLQGSPASPASASKAGAGVRQGRRRTLPPPMLVESFERLAALHRARSDSEQQEGGIEWRLPPAMRGGRSPLRAAARVAEQLPPLHGANEKGTNDAFAAELHALRQRCPGGILANARRRGSWKQPTPPSPPPAAEAPTPPADGQLASAGAAAQPSLPHRMSALESLPAGTPAEAAAVQAAAVPQPAPQQTAANTPRAQTQAGGGPADTQQPVQLQGSSPQLAGQAQAAQQQAVQWRQRQVQYLRGLAPQQRSPQQAQQQQQHAPQQMQPQAQLNMPAQAQQQQQQQQAQLQQPLQAHAAQLHQQVRAVQVPAQQYSAPQAPVPGAPAYWWQQQQAQQAQQAQRLGQPAPPQPQQAAWAHAQQQAAYQQAAWAQQHRQQQLLQQQLQATLGQQTASGRRKWQAPAPVHAAAGSGPVPQRQQATGWAQQAPPMQQYQTAGQQQHGASPYGWQQVGGAPHPAAAYNYCMPGSAPAGYMWPQQAYPAVGYSGYQNQGSLPPLGQSYAR